MQTSKHHAAAALIERYLAAGYQKQQQQMATFDEKLGAGRPPRDLQSISPMSWHSAATSSSSSASSSHSAQPPAERHKQRAPILIKYNYYDFTGERHEQQVGDMNQFLAQRNLKSAPSKMEPSATLMLQRRRYRLSSYENFCLRCKKQVYQMDKVGPLKDFTFYHQHCFKCRECGTKLTLKTYYTNQHSSAADPEVYCHRHCPKQPAGKLDNQSVGIRAALNAPKVFATAGHAHALAAGDWPAQNQSQAAERAEARLLVASSGASRLQELYERSQIDKKIAQFIGKRLEYLEPKQRMLEMRHREEEEQLFRVFEKKWKEEESEIKQQIKAEWQLELEKLVKKYARHLEAEKLRRQQQQQQQLQVAPTSNNNNRRHRREQDPKAANQLVEQQVSRSPIDVNSKQQQQQQPPTTSIELERLNLEKTMTIKLDRKKETLKRKLKEFERQATAELVEKQSKEMLQLISMKLEEFKQEQKRKIGSDLEQFEALESLANRLGASLQLIGGAAESSAAAQSVPINSIVVSPENENNNNNNILPRAKSAAAPPSPPQGGRGQADVNQLSKLELYQNDTNPDRLFGRIDRLAIGVAREDQRSFTELVHHLTRECLSDVEKVRSIFRWITVKNLNTMHFDSSIQPDTPLGLLRGIKQGSESYHVLFKRLCSYAGLHCVVIKGYSKSAGYQPGVRFEGNRFRNSWNAVYVAGAWRFVQCNWGARHLVSVAVMQDKNNSQQNSHSGSLQPQQHNGRRQPDCYSPEAKYSPSSPSLSSTGSAAPSSGGGSHQDGLRYEYDDHYFLTDPEEFIYEFFPLSPEWQLLKSRPITLAEFEQLPFVRSLFFKYGLYFPQPDIRAVLHADQSGAVTIKIGMPTHMVPSLIFHYNLKYYHSDVEHYDSVSLKRFVMQSVESGAGMDETNGHGGEPLGSPRLASPSNQTGDSQRGESPLLSANVVTFRVHLPENGAYILDIFANSTTPMQYVTGEPMKFKSVCKFKIIAKNLQQVMIPLPDCASGEFGPMKATRLFGLIPISHEMALINVQNDKRLLEIQFRMTRPLLDFMASLHKNDCDEKQLSKLIKIFIDRDIVYITIKFNESGQYGLDIYTRDRQQQQLPTVPSTTPTSAVSLSSNAHNHILSNGSNKVSANFGSGSLVNRSDACDSQLSQEPKKQLLTHCCKYLINVKAPIARSR